MIRRRRKLHSNVSRGLTEVQTPSPRVHAVGPLDSWLTELCCVDLDRKARIIREREETKSAFTLDARVLMRPWQAETHLALVRGGAHPHAMFRARVRCHPLAPP